VIGIPDFFIKKLAFVEERIKLRASEILFETTILSKRILNKSL
jgi:hypothetical protein